MARGTFHTCQDAYALAEAFARRCEDPHPDQDGWRARCPNHHGKSDTSLAIMPGEGKILVKCFADCATADIVHALGLIMADLFVVAPAQHGARHILAIYDYYDRTGTLVHQTVRFDPKDFRQRRPHPTTPGKYVWSLKGIEPVLYHLPAIMQAVAQEQPIYLVEGEKDADLLQSKGLVATCNPMGAGKWRASYTKALRGAHVIVLPDYDQPGVKHAYKVAVALLGMAATIKIVHAFHTEASGSDISDWMAAGGTRETFERIIASVSFYDGTETTPPADETPPGWPSSPPGWPSSPPGSPPPPQPGIVIEQYRHLLPQVVSQAQDALFHMPGAPLVFQRARRLVAIAPAEQTAKGITRVPGTPIISALTAPRLRALLAKAAAWLTPSTSKKDQTPRPDMPQPWVVDTLLDQEAWTFPPLTGIVSSPTMRPDGSLITTQGYDADTGLWLAWHGATFPSIAEAPTLRDAQHAMQVLQEPFQDFPFAAPWHASAVLAAILTLLVRYAVQSVPLFAIRATTRGSGKTLLADAIAMVATGRPAPKMPPVQEEEEERKRLLALALDGDPLVVIDNVVGALGNPALDLAVTSQLFKDRLLGKNATKEAPMYTVFLATGNNMLFKGDMARRAVPIDLAPDMESPETRTGFVHPRLLDWILPERPRLISAALTLLRAYWVAGKPPQPIEPYGSFDLWSDLIRASLVWAGAEDPCLGREGLEAASDETFDAHAELLSAWHACYGRVPMALTQVIGDLQLKTTTGTTPVSHATEEASMWNRLRDALGFFDPKFTGERLNAKALGRALRHLTGRVINGKRLKKIEIRSMYGTQWAVEIVQKDHVPF